MGAHKACLCQRLWCPQDTLGNTGCLKKLEEANENFYGLLESDLLGSVQAKGKHFWKKVDGRWVLVWQLCLQKSRRRQMKSFQMRTCHPDCHRGVNELDDAGDSTKMKPNKALYRGLASQPISSPIPTLATFVLLKKCLVGRALARQTFLSHGILLKGQSQKASKVISGPERKQTTHSC